MIEMNKVHEALLEIVSKATFTPEALAQMTKALERVKELETALDGVRRMHAECQKEIDRMKAENLALSTKASLVQMRDEAVAKREAVMTELEKKLAVAEAKENVRREVFETIFRNVQTRRNVVETIPISQMSNGYTSVMPYQKGEQITEEQG
jgi:chromosome segregation ATPase